MRKSHSPGNNGHFEKKVNCKILHEQIILYNHIVYLKKKLLFYFWKVFTDGLPEEPILYLSYFMVLPAYLSSFLGSNMFFYVSFYKFLKTLFLSWWILLQWLVLNIPKLLRQTMKKSSAKISNLSQALFYAKLKKRWRSSFYYSLNCPTVSDKGSTSPDS